MKKVLFFITVFCLFSIGCLAQQKRCEDLYKGALDEFKNENYEGAKSAFVYLNQTCEGYKEVASKIRICENKIKEKKVFDDCKKQNNYDPYLKEYSKGEFAKQATERKAKSKKPFDKNAEDKLFRRCTSGLASESECQDYLDTYRNSSEVAKKRKDAVQKELNKIQERERKEKERLRQQARQTAYMNIRRVDFANFDDNENMLNDFGSAIYASDLKYLTPRIIYDGIIDLPEVVTISCKIFDPNGKLKVTSNASRYTFKDSFLVMTGNNHDLQLSGYGSSTQGFFIPGNYTFQMWFEERMIYETEVYIGNKSGDAIVLDFWRSALSRCRGNASQDYGPDGSYKGQIKDWERSGLGMYSWNNGACYIGSWNAGFRNGMGIYIASKGNNVNNCDRCSFYVGEWRGDVKSGMGRCYDAYGHLIYDGRFSGDSPTQTYPATTENKNLMFKCYDYSSDCYYVGETRNGQAHGKGMLIWTNKSNVWYGDFEYGARSGYGVYISNSGDITTGYWQGDFRQ